MSTPNQDPAALLHEHVGLPAFFQTVAKEAGYVPQTQQDADLLWDMGCALLHQERQKQAQAASQSSGRLAKAAEKMGLKQAGTQTQAPDLTGYVTAVLQDQAMKTAMAAYKQAVAG